MKKKHPFSYLFRPADILLPLAFLAASLLGRGAAALALFAALYAVKLCSLAASDGLRATFAAQPSVKYVQGSAIVALIAQLPGAALAALILHLIPGTRVLVPLVPCGMLLNAEQVFCEYLYAIGDKKSAMFSRCITAGLTLLGLMLCMPRNYGAVEIAAVDPAWPLITSALSACVGLVICIALGGKRDPKLNFEVMRRAPLSMLQAALCPALMLAALTLLWPAGPVAAPLFAGLALYEACRTPFRRSPLESRPMNRLLLAVAAVAAVCGALSRLLPHGPLSDAVAMTSVALLIAALCAFGLYGSITIKK